jgi:hypothetical protein
MKVSEYKDVVTDFNTANFSLLRLNVSPLLLDRAIPALVIRKFRDGEEAKTYYNRAVSDPNFLGPDTNKFKVYFIGQNNYRTILQKNVFSAYIDYFDKTLKN